MDFQAKVTAKIGQTMLISLAFFILIVVLFAQLSWAEFAGILILMALTLRWNLARIDKKYDQVRERED